MSRFFVDPAMAVGLAILIKASVLLGATVITQTFLRRCASAATRHLVWTLAIVGLLLLPTLSLALPDWRVVVRTAEANTVDVAVPNDELTVLAASDRPSPFPSSRAGTVGIAKSAVRISAPTLFATVYAAGLLVMLIHLGIQWRTVRRLAREASEVQDPEWTRIFNECASRLGVDRPVRLLRSRECSMPMASGTCQPVILIPAIAETWAENRRRAVILHELAHVARYDCLMQMLAFATCALYWFHPAAWWVARRLRIESDLACDDCVIAAGTPPREYANHLLEIAYAFGNERAPALAVSMAHPRQLESRMLAAMDVARNRRLPAMRIRFASAAIASALLLPLASLTPTLVAADMDVRPASVRIVPSVVGPQDLALVPHLPMNEEDRLHQTRAVIALEVAAAMGTRQAQMPGSATWEIGPTSKEGIVDLRFVEGNSSFESNVPSERLEGLTAAQLKGAGGPVQFRLRRDAGTFTFEGVLRKGVGGGTFSFTLDLKFPEDLAKLGFARPTAREQYQMARHDIGYAFVEELNKQGYSKPETSELVRAGRHGVHITYIREMGALGYQLGSLESLITFRNHGVTPEYIRELAQLGYKGLPADELRRAREHGISPEYVRAMRDTGYGSLQMDELIKARSHGVSPEFVREVGDAGHGRLPLDQLIQIRDHGVSREHVREMRQLGRERGIDRLVRARDHGIPPDYVRAMRDAGYGALTIEQLIEARSHGVDVEFVRGMATLGYVGLSMESLIRLRTRGVTPIYVQELKTLGYDDVAIEDLVTLRNHGLTAERIRAANARAGTRLPIDLLNWFAAGMR